jgi:predicted metal-dependent phosphoesterase TrpH
LVSSRSHPPAVDLHIHSTASDGTVPPGDLAARAASVGLRAISLTDHDTVDGVRELLRSPLPRGLDVVTGVEISTAPLPRFSHSGSLHVLGYGIDIDHPPLLRSLERLQSARSDRNPRILERLRELGIDIGMAELLESAGGGQAGRPHIAELLVRKGHAGSVDEAFDRYLGSGKPAYVDKYRIPCTEAIDLIHSAGGVAVLAHPGVIRTDGSWTVEDMIAALAARGLDGIEVYYPEHDAGQTRRFGALADRLGVVATGGTDYHGDLTPGVELGAGTGGFRVPEACYNGLMSLLRQRNAAAGGG